MRKSLFLVCFLLLIGVENVYANGRQYRADSLRNYYDKYFDDPTDPIVLSAADTLLEMAAQQHDAVMTKLAMGAKLDYYYYGQGVHRTDSVIAWVDRLKDYAKKIESNELYYWVWSARLVNFYIKQGQYNMALVEAEKMLDSAQKDNLKSAIAECYFALANVYSAKGLFKKSQEFMLKEIDLFERYDFVRPNISLQYSDAARIYIENAEKDKATELLKSALRYATTTYHTVTAKLVSVALYLAQNNISAAQRELEECRQMYEDDPTLRRHIHYFYTSEIDFYRQTGNYPEALEALDRCADELRRMNDVSGLSGLTKTKADLLWDMGNKEEAAGLYRDYLQKKEKEEKEKNEDITTGEFATLLNLQQLTDEKKELEEISEKTELRHIQIMLFSLVGILCIVIIFFYRQHKLNVKLQKSRDELDEKNRTLIEAEEELRKAKDVAEEISWMKTVFIQNMSHEIRTPLNSIVGFSAILADMFKDMPDIRQYATLIEENSRLLLKLISDILDISALDNDLKIERSPVNVNSCCHCAMDKVRYLFNGKVELKFEPCSEELFINSNYERITQVLENLLNNASKFTHHGSVTLACNVSEEDKTLLVFTVTDTGMGIPADQQERVFERFVKLSNFSQGTGLGLSICRIVAERLGGQLIVDREYTKGTRFIFSVAV